MASKIEYIREILNLNLDCNPPYDYDPNLAWDELVCTNSIHPIFSRNFKMLNNEIKSHVRGKIDYHLVSIHNNLIFGFNIDYIYLTKIHNNPTRLESILISKTEFNNDDLYLILNYSKWLR